MKQKKSAHYNDVIMTMVASQITSLTVVYSIVYQAQIKENIQAPRHWPLCGEFTGTGEFPARRASYVENVSIWWRHHETEKSTILAKFRPDWTELTSILQLPRQWRARHWAHNHLVFWTAVVHQNDCRCPGPNWVPRYLQTSWFKVLCCAT